MNCDPLSSQQADFELLCCRQFLKKEKRKRRGKRGGRKRRREEKGGGGWPSLCPDTSCLRFLMFDAWRLISIISGNCERSEQIRKQNFGQPLQISPFQRVDCCIRSSVRPRVALIVVSSPRSSPAVGASGVVLQPEALSPAERRPRGCNTQSLHSPDIPSHNPSNLGVGFRL